MAQQVASVHNIPDTTEEVVRSPADAHSFYFSMVMGVLVTWAIAIGLAMKF
jgi:hypothetical protein